MSILDFKPLVRRRWQSTRGPCVIPSIDSDTIELEALHHDRLTFSTLWDRNKRRLDIFYADIAVRAVVGVELRVCV